MATDPWPRIIVSALFGSTFDVDPAEITASQIHRFRPPASDSDSVERWIEGQGEDYRLVARTGVGISWSISRSALCRVTTSRSKLDSDMYAPTDPGEVLVDESAPLQMPPPVTALEPQPLAAGTSWSRRELLGVLAGGAAAACLPPTIAPLEHAVQAILHGEENPRWRASVHGRVRVAVVDTGGYSRTIERCQMKSGVILVDQPIVSVLAVWSEPARREAIPHEPVAAGSKTIRAADQATNREVFVEYSHVDHRMAQFADRISVVGVGDLDPHADELGHGIAVLAHLFAVAPRCEVLVSKYADASGIRNHPIAAFQKAVNWGDEHPGGKVPDVIVCPWVLNRLSIALQLEIADAVSRGIVVLFPSGNGEVIDDPFHGRSMTRNGYSPRGVPWIEPNDPGGTALRPVAHPDVLSVGGATTSVGPSDRTASFDSTVFTTPLRHCPDVAGLADRTDSVFDPTFETPTQHGSMLDLMDAGPNTTLCSDGIVMPAGTSISTAQVAGMVATLLRRRPDLRCSLRGPNGVKNTLCATAQAANLQQAGVLATSRPAGHGLVDGAAALNWLSECHFRPFIRATLEDLGNGERKLDGISPDIVMGPSCVCDPGRWFGLTTRHVQQADSEPYEAVWVRVQNRGRRGGTASVSVFRVRGKEVTSLGRVDLRIGPGGFEVAGPFGPLALGSPSEDLDPLSLVAVVGDPPGGGRPSFAQLNDLLVIGAPTIAYRNL